jgi:hypothetical protein
MAETNLVNANFNDQSYSSPLNIYTTSGYNTNVGYTAAPANGGLGYSIVRTDYTQSTLATLTSLASHLGVGLYFRYYVYFPGSYDFPGERVPFDFENLKVFKIAGAGAVQDVEIIYKATSSGTITRLQLYWYTNSGPIGGTGTGDVLLPTALVKDSWHKIEIYIRIPETTATASVIHVHIDDEHVYENSNADMVVPGSTYTGTSQFISTDASDSPEAGHGTWYFDDIYISESDSDLMGLGSGEEGSGASVPLANNGDTFYWRIAMKTADGKETPYSNPDNRFDMAIIAAGNNVFNTIRQTGGGNLYRTLVGSGVNRLPMIRQSGTCTGASGASAVSRGNRRVFIGTGVGV